jgi:hypothetical protein
MAIEPTSDGLVSSIAPNHNWERFWIARTGTIDLSDGGFFADPTYALLNPDASTPLPLARLADYPALVLLGEPGIGKSTALKAEAIRLASSAPTDTISLHVDLRAYSSELLLHKKVFENAEFIAWTQGNTHLVLHLDSLDEALLRIDSIANLLAEELARYPTSRMSVRIACRTAIWPAATL